MRASARPRFPQARLCRQARWDLASDGRWRASVRSFCGFCVTRRCNFCRASCVEIFRLEQWREKAGGIAARQATGAPLAPFGILQVAWRPRRSSALWGGGSTATASSAGCMWKPATASTPPRIRQNSEPASGDGSGASYGLMAARWTTVVVVCRESDIDLPLPGILHPPDSGDENRALTRMASELVAPEFAGAFRGVGWGYFDSGVAGRRSGVG